MRRALVVAALPLVLPAAAQADTLSLRTDRASARFASSVRFTGELVPARDGVPVALYAGSGSAASLVASATTRADGSYALALTVRRPRSFRAVAQLDSVTQAVSAPVSLRIRPRLAPALRGARSVGERLVLSGRLRPAAAGRLSLAVAGRRKRVRVDARGRFAAVLPTKLPGRRHWSLVLLPRRGFERVERRGSYLVTAPALAWGARGRAVRALEARLLALRYALRGVDGVYRGDTVDAVLAFQKVHGLRRTGYVTRSLWSRLARASVPRPLAPGGTHVEVSKTRQVLFEVVAGEVARVVHVSTGATGNTPVGSWRVYRLGPGTNALGMYYSLYFLRGFAIHGYRSVPPYPASHGCVRTPMWFARGFYARWARLGTRVFVFP